MNCREIFVNDRLSIAITSLQRLGNKIYLGLTGGAQALAVYDTETATIEMCPPVFPWVTERGYCTKIHNAIGALPDGSLVMGEGNHFTWDGIPVTTNYFDTELPEFMLERKKLQGFPDVKYSDFCLENLENWDRMTSDPGGKIVRYIPETGAVEIIAELPQFAYTQSMLVDTERQRGFGHTIPDNHFFYIDFTTGKLTDFGHISDYAQHNMVVTPDGICYGGWLDRADGSLKLLKFDPKEMRLRYLNNIILPDIGCKVAGNQGIDEWIVTRDGRIFMGTVANALLFEFHWAEEKFELIATLGEGGRVTNMDEDDDGNIWIGANYPHMHLIRFQPDSRDITDMGRLNDNHSRCYFHASCYHKGKLYLGETDGFSPSLHIVDLGLTKK
jgi:hypothetical protein